MGGVSLTQGYSGSLTEGMVTWGPLLTILRTRPSRCAPSAYAQDVEHGESSDATKSDDETVVDDERDDDGGGGGGGDDDEDV